MIKKATAKKAARKQPANKNLASADWFFEKESKWQEEYRLLRKLVQACGLTEALKWGCPCYTHDGANVVLIHGFKEYCALLFLKGALLKDAEQQLIQQTQNVQSARQLRFTSVGDVKSRANVVQAYVREAVEVERAGVSVALKKTTDYEVVDEFQKRLNKSAALNNAFAALTPGRQRAYLMYFAQAKQEKTREARVAKCVPQILEGRGLDD